MRKVFWRKKVFEQNSAKDVLRSATMEIRFAIKLWLKMRSIIAAITYNSYEIEMVDGWKWTKRLIVDNSIRRPRFISN